MDEETEAKGSQATCPMGAWCPLASPGPQAGAGQLPWPTGVLRVVRQVLGKAHDRCPLLPSSRVTCPGLLGEAIEVTQSHRASKMAEPEFESRCVLC